MVIIVMSIKLNSIKRIVQGRYILKENNAPLKTIFVFGVKWKNHETVHTPFKNI